MTMQWGTNSRTFSSNAQINTLVFNAGLLGAPASATNPVPCTALPCPIAVVVGNGPAEAEQKVKSDLGFFVQDTWTMNRLTLNLGGALRSVQRRSVSGAVVGRPCERGSRPRDFAAIPNVPNWNDWSVRLAGAYDLFGNGKTAIKANASKYIAAAAAGYAAELQPDDLLARRRAPGSTSTATSRSSMPPATSSSTK